MPESVSHWHKLGRLSNQIFTDGVCSVGRSINSVVIVHKKKAKEIDAKTARCVIINIK